jgi:hypothetical protein
MSTQLIGTSSPERKLKTEAKAYDVTASLTATNKPKGTTRTHFKMREILV